MVFETSVDSPFNLLIQLLAGEYFLECSRRKSFKLFIMMMIMLLFLQSTLIFLRLSFD